MRVENYKKMVELQHDFNQQVDKQYLDRNWNWNSAIIAESGELLESAGYKWWSKCSSPVSEKLRNYYYYKDGNIYNKITHAVLCSRFDKKTGYFLSVNSDLCFNIEVSTIGLHKLIYMLHYGDIPKCAEVDHIDQNKLNNKIDNLRLLSKRDNQLNSSKVENAKGYHKMKDGRFQSQIRARGQKIYLGSFKTEDEASAAYHAAKEIYHILTPLQANGFKNCIDMDNVKVEAIDLLHFVISESIQIYYRGYKDSIECTYSDFQEFFEEFDTYDNFDVDSIFDIINHLNYDQFDRFFIMKQLFKHLDMSNEDVYLSYMVKNCLNRFRQDNGYKDGSYHKIWNNQEDNVVAYELAVNIGAVENLYELLYDDLKVTYSFYFKA